MLHRPFDANSEEYYKLLKKLIADIDDVTRVNSMIDFSEERRRLLVLLDDLGRKFL